MSAPSVPEQLVALLSKEGEEPYNFSKETLGSAEAILKKVDASVAKDVFRVAYILDRKLESPKAARALLHLALRFFDPDRTYSKAAAKGPISEETWRQMLGEKRELPPEKPVAGQKLWDVLKS